MWLRVDPFCGSDNACIARVLGQLDGLRREGNVRLRLLGYVLEHHPNA
jgi:hypothetical protein